MSLRRMALTGIAVVVGGAAVFTATPLGRDLVFHVLPVGWTGEAERLAAALQIGPGTVVADIGAGTGSFIIELSRLVGPEGRALATERTPDQRRRIVVRAAAAGVNVTVLEAAERSTNLPDACCDAIVMRMVMHHIVDAGGVCPRPASIRAQQRPRRHHRFCAWCAATSRPRPRRRPRPGRGAFHRRRIRTGLARRPLGRPHVSGRVSRPLNMVTFFVPPGHFRRGLANCR